MLEHKNFKNNITKNIYRVVSRHATGQWLGGWLAGRRAISKRGGERAASVLLGDRQAAGGFFEGDKDGESGTVRKLS